VNPLQFLKDTGDCIAKTVVGTCELIGQSCSSLWQASCCGEPDLDEAKMDEVIRRIDAHKLYVKGLEQENLILKRQIDYMGKIHHENRSPEEPRESEEKEGN
jgi:isopentenyldiphosphate isomerase